MGFTITPTTDAALPASGLVPWPRKSSGPATEHRWIQNSRSAALRNLEELPGDRFGELVRELDAFWFVAECERREGDFLPARVRDVARAVRELERHLIEGQPSPGEARHLAKAHQGLCTAQVELLVASRDDALWSDGFHQAEAIGALLADRPAKLAEVLSGLPWVTGTHLAEVAIWLRVEGRLPVDPDRAKIELESRRSVWSKALSVHRR